MARRLRIGILGLGRRWPRYRRALLALTDELRPVAVHDPAPARAEQEARLLGAQPAAGVVELVERPDIEALLLTGGAWYGLWPLEQAARAGKPVLCVASPTEDGANLATLREKLAAAAIHVALWPALTVLRESLADRLQESLGRPHFVQLTATRQAKNPPVDLLTSPAAVALLRECADLFGSAPEEATVQEAPGLAAAVLAFPQGATAQLTVWAGPAARNSCRVQVEAEDGAAWAELPRVVEWVDGEGRHHHELPAGMAEMVALDRFAQAVRDGEPPACSFTRACEPLDWLRVARSLAE